MFFFFFYLCYHQHMLCLLPLQLCQDEQLDVDVPLKMPHDMRACKVTVCASIPLFMRLPSMITFASPYRSASVQQMSNNYCQCRLQWNIVEPYYVKSSWAEYQMIQSSRVTRIRSDSHTLQTHLAPKFPYILY